MIRAPGQRLLGGVLGPHGHQAGHLVLGQLDLLAAEAGEGEISHLEVGGWGAGHDGSFAVVGRAVAESVGTGWRTRPRRFRNGLTPAGGVATPQSRPEHGSRRGWGLPWKGRWEGGPSHRTPGTAPNSSPPRIPEVAADQSHHRSDQGGPGSRTRCWWSPRWPRTGRSGVEPRRAGPGSESLAAGPRGGGALGCGDLGRPRLADDRPAPASVVPGKGASARYHRPREGPLDLIRGAEPGEDRCFEITTEPAGRGRRPGGRRGPWPSLATLGGAVLMASGLLAACSASSAASPPATRGRVLLVGTYRGHRGQFATIQSAVDAAKPGDWILVGAGRLPRDRRPDRRRRPTLAHGDFGGVVITHRRTPPAGHEPHTVVVDGTKAGAPRPAAPTRPRRTSGPPAPTARPYGRNGIVVWKADNVSVENLTACNFLAGTGDVGQRDLVERRGRLAARSACTATRGSYLDRHLDLLRRTAPGQQEATAAQYGIFSSNSPGPAAGTSSTPATSTTRACTSAPASRSAT